ncbi:hypothetical protein M885DRAFT_140600 [Pelagophyceae sp. CCMP2097]|nr:hypothetical protein M885DRAFT_140600 [Pelagophyceae sp. CCMP2097]
MAIPASWIGEFHGHSVESPIAIPWQSQVNGDSAIPIAASPKRQRHAYAGHLKGASRALRPGDAIFRAKGLPFRRDPGSRPGLASGPGCARLQLCARRGPDDCPNVATPSAVRCGGLRAALSEPPGPDDAVQPAGQGHGGTSPVPRKGPPDAVGARGPLRRPPLRLA